MNRGLNGIPAGQGLTLGSLGDVQLSPTSVVAPFAVPRAGDQTSWDVSKQKYVLRRGSRWEPSANLYNARPEQFYRWRTALAKARLGVSDVKIAFIGDSTTLGTGSSGTDYLVTAYPARFAQFSNTYLGIPGTSGADWVGQTSRWGLPSGWTSGGFGMFGQGTIAATGPLTFTPPAAFDTIQVWYYPGSGFGTTTVNVDGGASLGTLNTNVASPTGLMSQTFTCTPGTHTVNLTVPTINTVYPSMIDTWMSTTKSVRSYNFGAGGKSTADFVLTGGASFQTFARWRGYVNPDLTVITLGVNDIVTSINPADTYANLASIVTEAQSQNGSVLLCTPMPYAADPARDYFVNDAVVRLATDFDLPMYDLYSRLGSTTLENANFGASGHLPDAGYADVGVGFASTIRRFS